MKIKLCGLTRPCDVAWANETRPDFAGFVFAGVKRRISPQLAGILRRQLHVSIAAVGVFADAAAAEIAALVRDGTIQWVQLHGHEDEKYIENLRRLTDAPLIQAFAVNSPVDLRRAQASSADYILLDSGSGGTGRPFDWSLLPSLERPFFLAGGISLHNVQEAARRRPFAVDVSSGIERDGHKSRTKIKQFMAFARAAARQEGL